jgi:hypothetical protein
MNTTTQDVDEEDVISKACELGCDTFLLPDEDGEGPGHWHFNQKYGEGISLVSSSDLQASSGTVSHGRLWHCKPVQRTPITRRWA